MADPVNLKYDYSGNYKIIMAARSSEASDSAADVIMDDLQDQRKRVKGKGKFGKLAGLMNIPLDVIYEILGHLRPLDLLHLSRTTKDFRRLLMDKSAMSHIWREARIKLVPELPDCPRSMSEPKYANLVWDQHCHVCLTPNIRKVDWKLRVRLCAECAISQIAPVRHCFPYNLVPQRRASRGCRKVCFLPELAAVKHQLDSFGQDDDGMSRMEYITFRCSLVEEIQESATIYEAWTEQQARERAEQREKARENRRDAIIEKLTRLGWADELEEIRKAKSTRGIDGLEDHKLVKQPTRLTERIWENIREPLIDYLEQRKVQRIAYERTISIQRESSAIKVLHEYKLSHIPFTRVMPEVPDFLAFPEVEEILSQPKTSITSVVLGPHNLRSVVLKFPWIVHFWRTEINRRLIKHFREQELHGDHVNYNNVAMEDVSSGFSQQTTVNVADDAAIDGRISLATTVFVCSACSAVADANMTAFGSPPVPTPLFYPQLFGHYCLTRSRLNYSYAIGPGNGEESCVGASMKLDGQQRYRTRWSCDELRIDKKIGRMVEDIVIACGLNPAHATPEDMDKSRTRLMCERCIMAFRQPFSGDKQLKVFGWRRALRHHLECHPDDQGVGWRKLPDADRYDSCICRHQWYSFDKEDDAAAIWLCVHCLDLPSEPEATDIPTIKQHLLQKHGIFNTTCDIDYYKAFEAPVGFATWSWTRTSRGQHAISCFRNVNSIQTLF